METVKSVFSGFQLDIDRDSLFRLMEINEESDDYEEICRLYDGLKDEAMRLIEPGVVIVLEDNELSQVSDEVDKCQYVAMAFCTAGRSISEKAAEYAESGHKLEAALFDRIGDLCVLRARKMADDVINKVARGQFLGKTRRYIPGKDANPSCLKIIIADTGAGELFGAAVSNTTDEIDPLKSLTFIYGCDRSLPLPAIVFDCDSCLRRDCEYCDAV